MCPLLSQHRAATHFCLPAKGWLGWVDLWRLWVNPCTQELRSDSGVWYGIRTRDRPVTNPATGPHTPLYNQSLLLCFALLLWKQKVNISGKWTIVHVKAWIKKISIYVTGEALTNDHHRSYLDYWHMAELPPIMLLEQLWPMLSHSLRSGTPEL